MPARTALHHPGVVDDLHIETCLLLAMLRPANGKQEYSSRPLRPLHLGCRCVGGDISGSIKGGIV